MAWIILTKGVQTEVDDELYFSLNEFKWYASGLEFRPARRLKEPERRLIYMYHQVLQVMPWELGVCIVDHIDGNPLNNMRANLRIVSRTENMLNSVRSICKTGISVDRTHGTFKAYIDQPYQKRINVGTYKTRDAAAEAIEQAKEKLKGGQ